GRRWTTRAWICGKAAWPETPGRGRPCGDTTFRTWCCCGSSTTACSRGYRTTRTTAYTRVGTSLLVETAARPSCSPGATPTRPPRCTGGSSGHPAAPGGVVVRRRGSRARGCWYDVRTGGGHARFSNGEWLLLHPLPRPGMPG